MFELIEIFWNKMIKMLENIFTSKVYHQNYRIVFKILEKYLKCLRCLRNENQEISEILGEIP